MKKHIAWFRQAEKDLDWGKTSLSGGHFAQTCFVAQQVAEKCLKAIAFSQGTEMVKSHSLVSILKELEMNGPLEVAARKLDLYYISARYPDALPDNALPSETFGKDQAEEALKLAIEFLSQAKKKLGI